MDVIPTTTIKDVAKYAGVSQATVSYVINNNMNEVSYSTQQKVLEAVKILNYHPNANARSLKSKNTRNIGLVMLHTETKQLLEDPWTIELLAGIADISREAGYSIVIDFIMEWTEETYSRIFRGQKTDGTIILGAAISDRIDEKLTADKVPHIFIDRYTEDTKKNCICIDNEGGAKKAIHHLASLGHQRIAYIGGDGDFASGIYRQKGFYEAMNELNLPIEPAYILSGKWSEESGYNALVQLFNLVVPPTAIFCANDRMAIGVLQAARVQKIKVPDQLSVVGFDNSQFSAFTTPPLTTLTVPIYEMGKLAANQIIAISNGKKFFRKEVFDVNIVIRNSTAPPALR
ncbi:MAG: LacI family DNA-binding transcriptional regulator [Bacillota bacterium]